MPRFTSWLTNRLSERDRRSADRVCMWMATGILIFTLMVAAVIVATAATILLVIAVVVGILADTWRAAGMKWISPNLRR